jgi:hypothetical protein
MATEESANVRLTPVMTWFCTALPLITFLVFLTMAVHVRLSLGHWPTDAIETKDMSLGLAFHEFIWIVMLFLGGFAAVPLWLILLFFRPLRISFQTHVVQALILALTSFILWGGLSLLPSHWVTWFID